MINFVIIRHVNSELSNNYWIECYTCIRKFYTENSIIIIDSNSNYKYVTDIPLINATIIRSEFPNSRGEILGYYYYYKSGKQEPAVILQDGMFIQKYIDFGSIPASIWNFNGDNDNSKEIAHMISSLNNNESLLKLYNNKNSWKGAFGSCAVVTPEFLKKLDEKYNIFNIISVYNSPLYCMGFERMVGLLLALEGYNTTILGDIFHYISSTPGYAWWYSYDNYINNKNITNSIMKVWSKRP